MLLYIHIPFCDSKCHYCSFNSFTTNHHLKKSYIDALKKQLFHDIKHFAIQIKSIESVFVGGGTPSCLKASYYEEIFTILNPYLHIDAEITFEANPNSASHEWLKAIKDLGANRVSFGVQSFDEKKLRFLGRAHTPKDALQAVENAKRAGFENISIDLIYNCAIDSKKLLENDIATALALPINHISAYALTIEPSTPFATKAHTTSQQEFGYFIKTLIPFRQYEVSNFGSYESTHNKGYWQLKNYLGIGAGAVGYWRDFRYYPPKDLHSYIQEPTKRTKEPLSKEDLRTEKIFLGLRSCIGVAKELLNPTKIAILLQEDKIYEDADRIYNKNFFLADEMALFLL